MSIFGGISAQKTLKGLESTRQEDPDLRDLRTHMRDAALAGPETLVAQQLNAVEKQAQPFVQSSDQFQSGLGMQQDPAFTEALSRRGQKIFDRDYTDLRRQLQLEAPSYQQQRMAAVMPAMAAKAQENINIKAQKSQNEAARQAARNAMISSITGGLGSVAGAGIGLATGGGAQGAAFGAQMGRGIFQ